MARVSSDAAPGIAGPGENLNNKAKTKLKAGHTKQLEELTRWITVHIAMLTEEEAEYKLANKREAFV